MSMSSKYAPDGGLLPREDRELTRVALAAAVRAGTTLMASFASGPSRVREKEGPVDLVSDADLASEEVILDRIARDRPDDAILSEEGGAIAGSSGMHWIVDPLDGTHNFVRGIPLWCVSIAVVDGSGTRIGVVNDPLHGECFLGIRGRGGSLNGRRLPLHEEPHGGLVLGGSCRRAVSPDLPRAARLARFASGFANTRELIAGALELAWTAAGRVDVLYHESRIKLVDKAAGVLVCSEAGLAVHELPPARDGQRDRLLVCPPQMSESLLAQVD